MKNKTLISIASFFILIAIIIGAFLAHILKKIATQEIISSIQTGVTYQIYHSLALLFISQLNEKIYQKKITLISICFILGILLFSFSIYILNAIKLISSEQNILIKVLGPVTPIGGMLFIIGWMILFFLSIKNIKKQ